MAWVVLIVAGLFEVGWAGCLKSARGFTAFWPSVGFGVCLTASMALLGWSLRTLPLSTAYAVWTGIGAVGSVIVGIAFLGESCDPRRLACAVVIIGAILALKGFSS